MRLILNTYNAAEIDGFSYAFVDLNADLARLILQRRELFIRTHGGDCEPDLVCMEYRDYSAKFLSGVPEDDNDGCMCDPEAATHSEGCEEYGQPISKRLGVDLPNTDNGGDFDEVDIDIARLKDYIERTDCDRMCITADSVYWTAYPHRSDRSLTVETNQIDFATVEAAAGMVAA